MTSHPLVLSRHDEVRAALADPANRDPLVVDDPGRFRPAPTQGRLTFGAGPRPRPGREVAPARAAGVVEAVRR
ncbi:hypothetical protein [Streptosporangium roseum]|uniref:hypothetical protein n=1 Tax=Streptosporangium roseum TaxID=2001 RepID=UPI00332D62D4